MWPRAPCSNAIHSLGRDLAFLDPEHVRIGRQTELDSPRTHRVIEEVPNGLEDEQWTETGRALWYVGRR